MLRLCGFAVWGCLLVLVPRAFSEPKESSTDRYDESPTHGLATERRVSVYPDGSTPPPVDRAPYAAYSADDAPGDYDLARAVEFIDGVAVKWGKKHGCVTCHTNGHYLIAPPELFGQRRAALEVRDFAEDWVASWPEIGLPDTEIVVAPAAFLTINNMQTDGRLRPMTINALNEAWKLQSVEGHWPNWVKCNWPPFEQDDHYGVTLMTIAMGMAPPSYRSTEPAKTGIDRLLKYLAHSEPEEVHHRAMLLWVSAYFEDVVSVGEKKRWMRELWSLQKPTGGWASGDLGRWRQIDGGAGEPPVMVAENGDGYGTGFVTYVLLKAGADPSDRRIRKAIAWLQANQQADGKWFTNSLRNEPWTSHFLTHTGTTFALKALVEAGEPTNLEIASGQNR